MSGGPLAAAVHGPLLLTAGSKLDPATAAEITRILPAGGTVDVLGGVGAISANVATSLTNLGFTVTRLWGAVRFATAVAVADSLPADKSVLLPPGPAFPAPLTPGPSAAPPGRRVLLAPGTSPPTPPNA